MSPTSIDVSRYTYRVTAIPWATSGPAAARAVGSRRKDTPLAQGSARVTAQGSTCSPRAWLRDGPPRCSIRSRLAGP